MDFESFRYPKQEKREKNRETDMVKKSNIRAPASRAKNVFLGPGNGSNS